MVVRDGAIYIVGRAVPGAVGFATAMLLTWVLPPDALGLYGIGMAVAVLGNSVLFEWLASGFMRWNETHQHEARFIPTVLALFVGASLVAALLAGAAAAVVLGGAHLRLACVAVFGTVAYGWFEFSSRVQILRFKPARYLAMSLLRNVLLLLGAVSAAHATGSAEAALLAGFAAMAVAGCLFSHEWASLRFRRFDPALARDLAAFGAPIGLTMFLSGLVTSGSPILLGALAGYDAAGAFSVAQTVVQNTLGVIAAGLAAATYPAAVRAAERADAAAAGKVLAGNYTLLLSLLLPAGAGLALLAPGVAETFVGPAHRGAVAAAMPWLAAAAVMLGLRAFYIDYAFQLAKKTGFLVRVVAVGAAVNVASCLALVPVFGHVGAAAGVAFAAAATVVHASLLARRACPVPAPLGETCRAAAATCFMAAVLVAAPRPAGALGLFAGVALGAAAYAAAHAVLDAFGPKRLRRAVLAARAWRGRAAAL